MPDTQSHSTNPLPDPNSRDATQSFHTSQPAQEADQDFRLTQEPSTKSITQVPLNLEVDGLNKIGRFEIRSKLGEGAFGVVFRGYDPLLDREVAIKVAKPGVLSSPKKVQRFLREAKATANLRHPNIVPLFETGIENNQHFIVSAYLEGKPLNQVIREVGNFEIFQAARLIQKIAEGVAYAHSQGIIHRDIKPHNILLDSKDEPVLLDFGLAQRADAGDEKLTQDGSIMGTPAYMAPEQAAGEGTAFSDQYSLGVTLYEMLTGRTPFEGGVNQQLLAHQMEGVINPRKLRPEIPRDLENICLKCLEKKTSQRYKSCADLASDLQKFQQGEIVSARHPSLVEKTFRSIQKNPAISGLIGLVFLVFAIGLVSTLWQLDRANFNEQEAKKAAKSAEDEKIIAQQREADAVRAEQTAEEKSNQYLEEKTKAETATQDAQQQAKRANNGEHTLFIELAFRAWERGDLLEVERNLSKISPTFQNTWETRFLKMRLASRARTINLDQPTIMASAVLPERNQYYFVSNRSEVKVVNLTTGESEKLIDPKTTTSAMAVSPDGKTLVLSTFNKQLEFWNLETKTLVKKVTSTPVRASGLLFSKNSRVLYVVSLAGTLTVYQSDGVERSSHKLDIAEITTAALSPNEKYLALGSTTTGPIQLWDLTTQQSKGFLKGHPGVVSGVCFSADSKSVYSCSLDNSIRIWDVEKLSETKKIQIGGLSPVKITVNKSGTSIITSSASDYSYSEIRITNPRTGELIQSYWAHFGEVLNFQTFNNGVQLFSGDSKGRLRLWNLVDAPATLSADVGPFSNRFSTIDGETVIGRTSENQVRVNYPKKDLPPLILNEDPQPAHVGMTSDGKRIYTLSNENVKKENRFICVYDGSNGQLIKKFPNHPEFVYSTAITSDGKKILAGSGNWNLFVWDASSGEMLHKMRHTNAIHAIACTSDQKLVYLAGANTISVFELDTGKPVTVFEKITPLGTSQGLSLALSPDNSKLYIGFQSGLILCLDAQTGKQLGSFTGHSASVHSLCLSKDGTRLFSGSGDKTVRVWDTEYYIEKMAIKGHYRGVVALNLVNNDTRLLAAIHDSGNGVIYSWDIIPESPPKK